MELQIRNADPIDVKKFDKLARKQDQSWQLFSRNQVHTLAIFNQQFDREGPLKNLIKVKDKTMERCVIYRDNLNNMLKEVMRKYGDDE
jgi:hypothetical protein